MILFSVMTDIMTLWHYDIMILNPVYSCKRDGASVVTDSIRMRPCDDVVCPFWCCRGDQMRLLEPGKRESVPALPVWGGCFGAGWALRSLHIALELYHCRKQNNNTSEADTDACDRPHLHVNTYSVFRNLTGALLLFSHAERSSQSHLHMEVLKVK